jgi:hypothetical protein
MDVGSMSTSQVWICSVKVKSFSLDLLQCEEAALVKLISDTELCTILG